MNKTTQDIEALREAIRYCSIAKEMYGTEFQGAKFKLMKVATPELLSSILDQIEAERQQRSAAEKDYGELEQSLNVANAATQAWKQRANAAEASVGVLEGTIARKEFDALKGEQVPVISKEKLCDWLEDNFDIDDSQRDAFANCFAHHCNCIVKGGE